ERRQSGERVQAVVHAIHRAVRSDGGDRGPSRARARSKAELLTFEIARVLDDRETRERGNDLLLRTWDVDRPRWLIGQSRVRLGRVVINSPRSEHDEHDE